MSPIGPNPHSIDDVTASQSVTVAVATKRNSQVQVVKKFGICACAVDLHSQGKSGLKFDQKVESISVRAK